MTTKGLLALAGLTVSLLPGCAPPKSSSVEGAWKLVHATTVQHDTLMGEFPNTWTGNDMKMWSGGHFAFVGRVKSDTSYTDYYGGGTYTLKGDHYEEGIQFHMVPSLVGTTVKMFLEIRNDTLIQTWPVRENGQIDRKNFYEERYVRID
jgi:hypothetical protein